MKPEEKLELIKTISEKSYELLKQGAEFDTKYIFASLHGISWSSDKMVNIMAKNALEHLEG